MEIICKNGTPTTRNPLNVYEQAQIRLEKIFGHFDNIYVSFSGGKDSGVLLQLCTDYIRKHCPGRKIGVFHLDYEIQYGETIRYVEKFWRRIAIFSKYIGYVYLSRYRPVLPCFKSFGVPGMKKRKIVG